MRRTRHRKVTLAVTIPDLPEEFNLQKVTDEVRQRVRESFGEATARVVNVVETTTYDASVGGRRSEKGE